MNTPTVYLAGPIGGLSYSEAVDWRAAVKSDLNPEISVFNPMRWKSYLRTETCIGDSYLEHPLSTRKGITTRDRFDVMRCDAVLVNFIGAEKVSIGTCIELGWADAWRKPVVIAMEPENIHVHAMVNEIAGYVVPTLEEAVRLLKAIL
jgi:nucleoside 2-deoxyribosyltransferase